MHLLHCTPLIRFASANLNTIDYHSPVCIDQLRCILESGTRLRERDKHFRKEKHTLRSWPESRDHSNQSGLPAHCTENSYIQLLPTDCLILSSRMSAFALHFSSSFFFLPFSFHFILFFPWCFVVSKRRFGHSWRLTHSSAVETVSCSWGWELSFHVSWSEDVMYIHTLMLAGDFSPLVLFYDLRVELIVNLQVGNLQQQPCN